MNSVTTDRGASDARAFIANVSAHGELESPTLNWMSYMIVARRGEPEIGE